MPYPIVEIEGIGDSYANKLKNAGVRSTDSLLKQANTPKARKNLAAKSGISEDLLLKWANCADLMRIRGVARQYSELLEAAGVDTVKELKQRRADNLTQMMREINDAKHLCKVTPSVAVVRKWIDQAKSMPRMISY